MHEGHRKRKKEWVSEHGFDSLRTHELLEVMLYYAIPRVDTNEIAHELIDRFGSLSGVTEAAIDELCEVKGVGFSTAVYLKMFSSVMRTCSMEKAGRNICVKDDESLRKYLLSLFEGKSGEHFYCISISRAQKIVSARLVATGTVDSVDAPLSNLIKAAVAGNTHSVIIAHNHPYGSPSFSRADCKYTERAKEMLETLGIEMIDHYLVAGDKCISFGHGII